MRGAAEFSRESKYYALHKYLSEARRTSELRLSFIEIERVLGFGLPPGARSHRAWWGNSKTGHSQSRAWLLAGWRTTAVDLTEEIVVFQAEPSSG